MTRIEFRDEDFKSLEKEILKYRKEDKKVFSFMNSHCVFESVFNKDFRIAVKKMKEKRLLNCFIDGFPISLFLSIVKLKKVKRLQGPKFMSLFFSSKKLISKSKHFFIGYDSKEIDLLLKKVKGLKKENLAFHKHSFIKGNFFSEEEFNEMVKKIKKQNPDYIWNGTGCPRQEVLSLQLVEKLKFKAIFNVGAGLEFLIGKRNRAPEGFQKWGLEWLHRLGTDPKLTIKRIFPSIVGILMIPFKVKLKKEK